MSADTVIALVYRTKGKSCRQYPFHSFDELEKFCTRKPYCGESLIVIPVVNRFPFPRKVLDASDVVEYVKTAREAA